MQKHEIMNRLNLESEYTGFVNADIVVEAVFEDLELKKNCIRELEKVIPDHCVIGTNTSALSIAEIAESSKNPGRVVGMHYFSPVESMQLLEVVKGPKTSDESLRTAVTVGLKQGKMVIVVNECPGFYTTRCLGSALNEIILLLQEGVHPEELDKLSKGYGWPLGLASLLDEVGIDVGQKVGHYLRAAYDERAKLSFNQADPGMFDDLVREGHLGKKTRKGIFEYTGKKSKKNGLHRDADTILKKYEKTSPSKNFVKEDFQNRIALRFVNEATRCLEEGIIQSPTDGDIGAVFGVGFPPRFGGPFKYVDTMGAAWVVENMKKYEEFYGSPFTPCKMLVEMAENEKTFY